MAKETKIKSKKPDPVRLPIIELGEAMGIHKYYINAIAKKENKKVDEFLVTSKELKKLYNKYYKGR